MGADIHFTLERKQDDKWVGIYSTSLTPVIRSSESVRSHPDAPMEFGVAAPKSRNYEFFAKLAGVRGPGPDPNGVPDDASELTRAAVDLWGYDGHSHGHCPLDEFCAKWVSCAGEGVASFVVQKRMTNKYFTVVDWLFEYLDDDCEYRVVFWFDN